MSDIDKDIERVKELQSTIYEGGDYIYLNKNDKQALENVLSELEKNKKAVDNLLVKNAELRVELETWKKIAEKLAEKINKHEIEEDTCKQFGKNIECTLFYQDEKHCIQCIIDWARKEVDND